MHTAEPNPPFGLNTAVDGLNLVLTWREPFSLEGEELSYVVSITNTVSSDMEEVSVNTSRYVLTEPIGERDCAEYQFTLFSKNDFSKSINAVTGRANIPTGKIVPPLSPHINMCRFELYIYNYIPHLSIMMCVHTCTCMYLCLWIYSWWIMSSCYHSIVLNLEDV